MTTTPHPRELLPGAPAEILRVLPAMGRVMLVARAGGATHERIGPLSGIAVDEGSARLGGPAHDSRIDLSVVARLVADRSGWVHGRALPRLECQDAAGETLFSLVGLDGVEPFDAALARFGAGEPLPPREKGPGPGANREVPEGDLGAATFAAILASGEPVSIEMRLPALEQAWQGVLPEPKPAMGFVNLMQDDFHLHLQAGAVARWRRREAGGEVELHAEDADGAGIGLVLRGAAAAFAAVPMIEAGPGSAVAAG